MAELHEGGDIQEYQEKNEQLLGEMKKQKDSQPSGANDKYEVSSIPAVLGVLLFLFVCYTVIEPETRRSNAVVKSRDNKTLVVQDLNDTSLYNVLQYDGKMTVDSKQAFSHVAAGDTLTYVVPENADTVSFSVTRKINGQPMTEFTNKRKQIVESAKIRNSLNQKTK